MWGNLAWQGQGSVSSTCTLLLEGVRSCRPQQADSAAGATAIAAIHPAVPSAFLSLFPFLLFEFLTFPNVTAPAPGASDTATAGGVF